MKNVKQLVRNSKPKGRRNNSHVNGYDCYEVDTNTNNVEVDLRGGNEEADKVEDGKNGGAGSDKWIHNPFHKVKESNFVRWVFNIQPDRNAGEVEVVLVNSDGLYAKMKQRATLSKEGKTKLLRWLAITLILWTFIIVITKRGTKRTTTKGCIPKRRSRFDTLHKVEIELALGSSSSSSSSSNNRTTSAVTPSSSTFGITDAATALSDGTGKDESHDILELTSTDSHEVMSEGIIEAYNDITDGGCNDPYDRWMTSAKVSQINQQPYWESNNNGLERHILVEFSTDILCNSCPPMEGFASNYTTQYMNVVNGIEAKVEEDDGSDGVVRRRRLFRQHEVRLLRPKDNNNARAESQGLKDVVINDGHTWFNAYQVVDEIEKKFQILGEQNLLPIKDIQITEAIVRINLEEATTSNNEDYYGDSDMENTFLVRSSHTGKGKGKGSSKSGSGSGSKSSKNSVDECIDGSGKGKGKVRFLNWRFFFV